MLLVVLQVRDEQAEAQAVAATVSAEEAEMAAQAAKCKALKDDAAADLVRLQHKCLLIALFFKGWCLTWQFCLWGGRGCFSTTELCSTCVSLELAALRYCTSCLATGCCGAQLPETS